MSDLYITWEEYHQNIEQLAAKIYQSQWQFNYIVCIAKGGLRVGDILARLYDQPLAILSANSYQGKGNGIRGEINFSQNLTVLSEQLEGNILLVDDLVDSGITLQKSIFWLEEKYPQSIREIRTAVIWQKASSHFVPNYSVHYLENNPWIHQPFEKYELMNPNQLFED